MKKSVLAMAGIASKLDSSKYQITIIFWVYRRCKILTHNHTPTRLFYARLILHPPKNTSSSSFETGTHNGIQWRYIPSCGQMQIRSIQELRQELLVWWFGGPSFCKKGPQLVQENLNRCTGTCSQGPWLDHPCSSPPKSRRIAASGRCWKCLYDGMNFDARD